MGRKRGGRRGGAVGLALVVGLAAAPAAALEQVAVAGAQSGFGVLRERAGECFVVLPRHVAEGAAQLRVTTRLGIAGSATLERDYGRLDLAILRVDQRSRVRCAEPWEVQGDLDRWLRPGQRGVVVSLGPGGAVESRFVLVERFDEEWVEVRPETRRDALRSGLSGSLILLADLPAAMLVSVDTGSGTGRAYRIDVVAETVARFFRAAGPAAAAHPWDGLWVAPEMNVAFRVKVRGPEAVDLATYAPADPYACRELRQLRACLPPAEDPAYRFGEVRMRSARATGSLLALRYQELRPARPDPALQGWTSPWLAPTAPWSWPGPGPEPGWGGPAAGGVAPVYVALEARIGAPGAAGPRTAEARLAWLDAAWQPLPEPPRLLTLYRLGD